MGNPARSVAQAVRGLLPSSLWRPLRAGATAVVTPLRFAFVTGHWHSAIATKARARSGEALPWYTYPAIDFLAQRSYCGRHVLEFGGGQSTLWWAKRADSVTTIEEDQAWWQALRSSLPGNVTLHHVPVDRATRTIAPVSALLERSPRRQFDVIVIDGHLRRELTALAFPHLAPGGFMVLDNAEGYGFWEELQGRDCRRIDFYGFAPGVSKRHCTSLVFVGDSFVLDAAAPIVDLER